jgi:pimeloyl-ACP methyl ester carboxylesterase
MDVEAEGWVERYATVNGVRLHYVEAGAGPPVILLHGFPEFWYAWAPQIPALATAGFRVVAPDLRGYNLSEKPVGVEAYRIEHLTADVAGLVRHLGAERAAVVGHDWGGVVAWYLAMREPALVERLVIVNAPHPATLAREIWRPSQLAKSSYVFAFQLPRLPEALFRAGRYWVMRRALRLEPRRPGAFGADDVRRYVAAIDRPGALTSAINYYRAAVRHPARAAGEVRRIACPTLLVWGSRDHHLSTRLTHGLERWVPDLRIAYLPEASHWVQRDAPERLNRLLVDFLRSGEPG